MTQPHRTYADKKFKIKEITVSFQNLKGDWEESEVYQIISGKSNIESGILNENTPLVKAVLETDINKIGSLPSGGKFLLLDKVFEKNIHYYVSELNRLKTAMDTELIEIGNQLPDLLAKAIEIPEKVNELFNLIITAKINNEELSSCISWLIELKKYNIEVDHVITKLKSVLAKQNGLDIRDINDVFTLNMISGFYQELRAFKKTKTILLKSLSLQRNNPITLVRLGKICRVTKSYDEGICYYLKSLELKESPYSYNGLGAIYRDINELQLAEECYLSSLALEDDFNHSATHRGLGAVYFDLELYEKGKEHFRLAGFNEEELFRMYNDAKQKNLNVKAVEILRLILEFDERNKKARYLLDKELGIT